MKLRYLFSMILASALMLVSCVDEMSTDSFDNIKLDKTMLVISENGGTVELKINATEAWAFDTLYTEDVWPNVITRKKNDAGEYYVSKVEESWLSVDRMAGEAGETVLKFTADTVAGGREIELCIKAGVNSQFIKIRQGSLEAVSATCADVLSGPDGKTYRVKGVCTAIANTTYGNWYLNDGTGEVYIYGTLDKDGKTKNYESWGMEVGDVVEVEGPKLTYGTTVELVDVTVIKIEKSLVKILTEEKMFEKEGGEFEVKVAYKGDGVFPVVDSLCRGWVSVVDMQHKAGSPTKIEPNPADTAVVVIRLAENSEPAPRAGSVTFVSKSGKSSSDVTYKFEQKGDVPPVSTIKDAYTKEYVQVEGTVVALCTQGFVLGDGTGYILAYYGKEYDKEYKLGDKVAVVGKSTTYNYGRQIEKPDYDVLVEAGSASNPAAVKYDATKINALVASIDGKDGKTDNLVPVEYAEMTGVLSISDGKYYNLTVEGTTFQGSLYNPVESLKLADWDGKNITVKGYVTSISGGKYVVMIVTSVAEAGAVEVFDEIKTVVADEEKVYKVKGVVVAVGAKAYVVADETGALLVYGADHGRTLMEMVKLEGKASHYKGFSTNTLQLATESVEVLSAGNTWKYNPTVLDGAALDAWVGKDASCAEVQFVGTVSAGQYVNISVEGANKQGSLYYINSDDYADFNGKKVTVKGYITGTYNYLNVLPYSVEEVK